MQVYVKAAHSLLLERFSRGLIIGKMVKCLGKVEPAMAVPALEMALELPKDNFMPIKYESDKIDMFDHLFDNSLLESRYELRTCVSRSTYIVRFTPSVDLVVEPTLTIGYLKSLLKRYPWTPKKDLMLMKHKEMHEEALLKDDQSTLADCGVGEKDTLLACMSGCFDLNVYYVNRDGNLIYFSVFINSCFETVGELKDKINQKTGYPPEALKLIALSKPLDNDRSPLVSEGVVKPFSAKMKMEVYMRVEYGVRSRWSF